MLLIANIAIVRGQTQPADEARRLEALRLTSYLNERTREGNTLVGVPDIKNKVEHVQKMPSRMAEKLAGVTQAGHRGRD